jgi:purine-binding chemotaxis protein CheW
MKKRIPDSIESIDWGAVKQRLAAVDTALRQDFAPAPETRREILQARARSLARQPEPEATQDAHIEILEFALAGERYAIDLRFVHEVYVLKELTPLPCAPDFVAGIVAVRGRILSVIDLKKFFGLPDKGLTDLNKIIVLREPHKSTAETMEFGLLADHIVGVRELPLAEMQPPLPTLTSMRADYLKGVTVERLAVLDARKLLEDETIVVEQEVA